MIDRKAYIRERVAVVGGCWIWQRSVDGGGYPRARLNYKTVGMHRVAYQEWVGPIPAGKYVRTKCRNPLCVNPEHLVLTGPGASGMRMGGALRAGRPCPNGHPFSPEDRAATGRGGTWCGECMRAKERARRAYKREWDRKNRRKVAA